jgi:hypothetical protein
MLKWTKKGRIWQPNTQLDWQQYYGILPTPEYLPEKHLIRVYFATACAQKYSRVSYIEVDADNPNRIVFESLAPILDIGEIGCFDDCGLNPSSIVSLENSQKNMYYVGYQRTMRVPYMLYIGLAQSTDDGQTWQRPQKTPIIDRNPAAPYSAAAPFVLYDEGIFKIWFWRAKSWQKVNDKDYLAAHIAYATSTDGLNFSTQTAVECIVPNIEKGEFSVGRPWVIKDPKTGRYKMWYSLRHVDKLYRIGYAESLDGINWTRKDEEAGIDVSATHGDWDSEMICYPAIVQTPNNTFMFYNGNNNGINGFGYALLEKA